MNRFALEVNMGTDSAPQWEFFRLGEDTSVSFTHNSRLFGDKSSGTFSESISINAELNRHIIGNSDTLLGSDIFNALHKRYFRYYFDGEIIMYGIIRMDKNVSIKRGSFEIELASDGQDFDDLIGDMNCRDVDIDDDQVYLGTTVETIACDGVATSYTYKNDGKYQEGRNYKYRFPVESGEPSQDAMTKYIKANLNTKYLTDNKDEVVCDSANTIYLDGKSFFVADEVQMHTREAYPTSKFCYDRKCWQKMTLAKNSDGSIKVDDNGNKEWTKERGYGITNIDNQRYLTPSFYVAYLLDKLFAQLGYIIVQNDMEEYADWNRLAMHNGTLNYKTSSFSTRYKLSRLDIDGSWTDANGTNNGCQNACVNLFGWFQPWGGKSCQAPYVLDETSVESYKVMVTYNAGRAEYQEHKAYGVKALYKRLKYIDMYAEQKACYATSDNFPDESIDTLIESLENAFNIRFVTDSNDKTVRIVSVDKVMRNANEITDIDCDVEDDIIKKSYGVSGYVLRYNGSNLDDIRSYNSGKVDFSGDNNDARYNYTNFKDAVLIDNYWQFTQSPAQPFDKTCYIDRWNGNAFRVRVDGDAEKKSELHASYFEVGSCIPAMYGDCSKVASDEGRIKDVVINFTPSEGNIMSSHYGPMYATFVDEELHSALNNEGVWTIGEHGMTVVTSVEEVEAEAVHGSTTVTAKFGYQFLEHITFDRSSGNDEHPLLSQDYGFVLGIMRGRGNSGTNDTTPVYDSNGNAELNVRTAHYPNFFMDSMDHESRVFDYNGDEDGIGGVCTVGDARGKFRSVSIEAKSCTNSDADKLIAIDTIKSLINDYGNVDLSTVKKTISATDVDSESSAYLSDDVTSSIGGTLRVALYYGTQSNISTATRAYLFTPYSGGAALNFDALKEYAHEIVLYANENGKSIRDLDAGSESGLFGKNIYVGYIEFDVAQNIDLGDKMRRTIDCALAYLCNLTDYYPLVETTSDSSDPLTEMEQRISLKIKAEKPIHTSNVDAVSAADMNNGEGYYKTSMDGAANRGLFDKFHKRYARFIVDAKEADIPVANISINTLRNLSDYKLYRIAGVTGYVLSYTYKLDNTKGITDVTIKMLYN